MKIYLVRDTEDNTVDCIFFNEESADEHCDSLGRYFDVTEFDTEDEPKDSLDQEV